MSQLPKGLVRGEDGLVRCGWGAGSPDYATYHDQEWGWPVHDDQRLFEKICLEGFQSGLSWLTILRKRDAFRQAFADFDYHRVARFNQRSVGRLLNDTRIVRHRERLDTQITELERAAATEGLQPRQARHSATGRSTRCHPDGHGVAACECRYTADMVGVLVRDEQRRHIGRLVAERTNPLLRRLQGHAAVDHDQGLFVLDQQCVSAAAAGERGEAHRSRATSKDCPCRRCRHPAVRRSATGTA